MSALAAGPSRHRLLERRAARAAAVPDGQLFAVVHACRGADARFGGLLVARAAALRALVGPARRELAPARPASRSPASGSRSPRRRRPTGSSLVLVVVSGLGVAAFHPEGSKFAAYASGSKRASGMSAFSIGGNIGFALGPIVATPLVLWLGLRGGLLLALPPLAIAVTLFALLPFLRTLRAGPRRSCVASAARDRPGALTILLAVIGFRSLAWWGLLTFVPLWEVSLGHSKAYGNHLLALMLLVGGLGTIAVGPLADRFGRRPVLVVSLAAAGAADPRLRRRRRRRRRDCARAHGHHRRRHVRSDDGDVAGVPAAAHRPGVRPVDRILDRPRRRRRARPRRARRRGRPAGGALRERRRAARGARVDAAVAVDADATAVASPRSQSRSRVRAMAESTREFFEGLPARADASKLAGMNNSYVFDIEGSGTWFVTVQDGASACATARARRTARSRRPRRTSRRSSAASRTRRPPT